MRAGWKVCKVSLWPAGVCDARNPHLTPYSVIPDDLHLILSAYFIRLKRGPWSVVLMWYRITYETHHSSHRFHVYQYPMPCYGIPNQSGRIYCLVSWKDRVVTTYCIESTVRTTRSPTYGLLGLFTIIYLSWVCRRHHHEQQRCLHRRLYALLVDILIVYRTTKRYFHRLPLQQLLKIILSITTTSRRRQ